jgi:hypothetical protein
MSISRVAYFCDGCGSWWRTEWLVQCPAKAFFRNKCQGVIGHKGIHWAFGPSGSFEWSDNRDDPTKNGECGRIPPRHDSYQTPESMHKLHYMNHRETTRVTDRQVLSMLTESKTPEPGASITRPIDLTEVRDDDPI